MQLLYTILRYIPRHGVGPRELRRAIIIFHMANLMNERLLECGIVVVRVSIVRLHRYMNTQNIS